MRGDDRQQLGVFRSVSAEQRVPEDHPLRAIRGLVDEALAGMSEHLDTLYAGGGRPSIAPEKLVLALLLQALYSVRSERQWMSSWTTTCCSAGSWGSTWTTRSGT